MARWLCRPYCLSLDVKHRTCWKLFNVTLFVSLMIVLGNIPRWMATVRPRYPASGNVLRYIPPPAARYGGQPGREFNLTLSYIESLGLPFKDFITLNETTLRNFAIAMAASKTHYHESLDAVASVQQHFPGKSIYYYDIGLLDRQIRKVKLWCNVVYRKFNFSEFPDHFVGLKTYGWKAMLVKDLFAEYDGVLWMDASTRLRSSNMSAIFRLVQANGGVMMAKELVHANHGVMHPTSYTYLPSNFDRQRQTRQCCTTSFLLYKTQDIYWNVLHWWFLCALEAKCMAPVSKSRCTVDMVRQPFFFGCHRYDQVTLNILNSNHYGYDTNSYCLSHNPFFLWIKREQTSMFKLQFCRE